MILNQSRCLLAHCHWNGVVALVPLHFKITQFIFPNVFMQRANRDLWELVRLSLKLLF